MTCARTRLGVHGSLSLLAKRPDEATQRDPKSGVRLRRSGRRSSRSEVSTSVEGSTAKLGASFSRGVLRSERGLSLENDLGHALLADAESVVDLALLSARAEQTVTCPLQIGPPKERGVFSANNRFGARAIKHLLPGRVVIEAFDRLLDNFLRRRLFAQETIGPIKSDL